MSLRLTDLFETLKEWHKEQLAFVEKYAEQIETLKKATEQAEKQKKSWINAHRWFLILVATLIVIFIVPLVMKKNDICQFSLDFNKGPSMSSCQQQTNKPLLPTP